MHSKRLPRHFVLQFDLVYDYPLVYMHFTFPHCLMCIFANFRIADKKRTMGLSRPSICPYIRSHHPPKSFDPNLGNDSPWPWDSTVSFVLIYPLAARLWIPLFIPAPHCRVRFLPLPFLPTNLPFMGENVMFFVLTGSITDTKCCKLSFKG